MESSTCRKQSDLLEKINIIIPMKLFKLILLIGLLILAINSVARDWFEGGSLHKATINEWKDALYADRLATSADWTVANPTPLHLVKRSNGAINELPRAMVLTHCIDLTIEMVKSEKPVLSIAVNCMRQAAHKRGIEI